MFRVRNIAGRKDVALYVNKVGENFCPFLLGSLNKSAMYFSEYDLDKYNPDDLQKFIFYTGLVHTSIFRKIRGNESSRDIKLLYCENIIYNTERKLNGKQLFSFPHWFLKLLYTPKGVLFGKFWKGENVKNKDGIPITIPPVHFLSIRSAIYPADKRFFNITPELKEYCIHTEDDGLTVLDFIRDTSLKNVIKDIENIQTVNKDHTVSLIEKLMNSTLYYDVAQMCSKIEIKLNLQNNYSSKVKNGK